MAGSFVSQLMMADCPVTFEDETLEITGATQSIADVAVTGTFVCPWPSSRSM